MLTENDNCSEEIPIQVSVARKKRKRKRKTELLAENNNQHDETVSDELDATERRKRCRITDSSAAASEEQSNTKLHDMVETFQSLELKVRKYRKRAQETERCAEEAEKRVVEDKCSRQEMELKIKELETKSEVLERLVKHLLSNMQQIRDRKSQLESDNEMLAKEKEELVGKEECRRFIYLLKDLATYKSIASKLRSFDALNQHEIRTLRFHCRREREISQGIEQKKRDGINGLFDTKNRMSHKYITSESVDECKQLLEKNPKVYTYYIVHKWSLKETEDFIESSREAVEQVNQYAKKRLCIRQPKLSQTSRKIKQQKNEKKKTKAKKITPKKGRKQKKVKSNQTVIVENV